MGHPPDARRLTPAFLFQLSRDEEFLTRRVVLHAQDVGLAADLAVFHVTLAPPGGFIDRGRIPFSAGRALEAGFHDAESIAQHLNLRRDSLSFSVSR
jgi:hypothetical protein